MRGPVERYFVGTCAELVEASCSAMMKRTTWVSPMTERGDYKSIRMAWMENSPIRFAEDLCNWYSNKDSVK